LEVKEMDLNKMSYDELDELKINLLDELDYYRDGTKKHDEIYFQLEGVYAELRKYK
jgi:hypothetical protein